MAFTFVRDLITCVFLVGAPVWIYYGVAYFPWEDHQMISLPVSLVD